MRRLASLAVLGFVAFTLGGCPIFSEEDGDYCPNGRCYEDDYCDGPGQCGSGEVCGDNNQCHVGDCKAWGCPGGYECDQTGIGVWECVIDSTGVGGGEGGEGGGNNPDVVWCGNPKDCAAEETCGTDGTCQPGDCTDVECIFGFVCNEALDPPACIHANPAGCGADADCISIGEGYACVSGECTAPADQCFDQTQCPSGDVCNSGKCTPSCAGGDVCPLAYTCDAVDTCTVPLSSCNITNDCGSFSSVCVDGACVPRAIDGLCLLDEVWVENGCIPDQSPLFVCEVEGQQDLCAAGSLCLHHSCYISCAAPNQDACVSFPEFDVCKVVATTTGEYEVCGSDTNLGSECDPTAGVACSAGLVCIDGFCK